MHNENDDDLKLCVKELRKVSEILWFRDKVLVSFQTYHFQKAYFWTFYRDPLRP